MIKTPKNRTFGNFLTSSIKNTFSLDDVLDTLHGWRNQFSLDEYDSSIEMNTGNGSRKRVKYKENKTGIKLIVHTDDSSLSNPKGSKTDKHYKFEFSKYNSKEECVSDIVYVFERIVGVEKDIDGIL